MKGSGGILVPSFRESERMTRHTNVFFTKLERISEIPSVFFKQGERILWSPSVFFKLEESRVPTVLFFKNG